MTEQVNAARERRFLIGVRKPWKLWIWPVIALLYLTWVMLIVLVPLDTGVPDQYWVLGGVGLFAFLVLVQLLLLPTVKVRQPKTKKGKKAAAARAAPVEMEAEAPPVEELDAPDRYAPPPEAVPAVPPKASDVELVLTPDEHKGRTVLEVSMPPKSANPGAVYSKAYVAVDDSFVLRIEDLVAGRADAR